jgi:hypothetical protein
MMIYEGLVGTVAILSGAAFFSAGGYGTISVSGAMGIAVLLVSVLWSFRR